MKFILKIVLSAIAVLFLSWLLPGVSIADGFGYAILVAAIISLLNTFLRPVLIFFTLPATVFTLGLFILVINTCIIMIADWFLDGFAVTNFWWALLFSCLLAIAQSMINKFLKEEKQTEQKTIRGTTVLIDKDGNVIK